MIVRGVDVAHHELHALDRSRLGVGEASPTAIEQPDPGGVSCTKRSCSLTRSSVDDEADLIGIEGLGAIHVRDRSVTSSSVQSIGSSFSSGGRGIDRRATGSRT